MSASLRSVDGQDEATILREIQSALRDLRFGAVEITCCRPVFFLRHFWGYFGWLF